MDKTAVMTAITPRVNCMLPETPLPGPKARKLSRRVASVIKKIPPKIPAATVLSITDGNRGLVAVGDGTSVSGVPHSPQLLAA
jgi:hypothetical protein